MGIILILRIYDGKYSVLELYYYCYYLPHKSKGINNQYYLTPKKMTDFKGDYELLKRKYELYKF